MPVNLNQFRYRCLTEACDVFEWRSEADGAPTLCKNDAGHTINPDSVVITVSAQETSTTSEGYQIAVLAERSMLEGNGVLYRKISVELESENETSVEWEIPTDKIWKIRLIAGSADADECEVQLDYLEEGVRVNPFDPARPDEPIAMLKLAGTSSIPYPEPLMFTGGGNKKLRATIRNKNSNYSAEVSGYINGFESPKEVS